MIPETLVILPGWGGSQETWQDFVNLAKKSIEKVEVIELPCFGNEPCPTTVWGVEDYAKFVEETLAKRHLDNVILLGHSFGGAVATYLISQKPNLAKKLILAAAAVYRPKRTIKRSLFKAVAFIGKAFFRIPGISNFEKLAKKILYKAADSPDYKETSGIQRDIYKKIVRQDQRRALSKISIPVQIIWGNKDTMTPLSFGKKLHAILPAAKFDMIEGATHGLHHATKQEFLERIKVFLTNTCV